MNFNDLKTITKHELNVKGVEFALNETLDKMGLIAEFKEITPSDVIYSVYTMEQYIYIGEITLANSSSCP